MTDFPWLQHRPRRSGRNHRPSVLARPRAHDRLPCPQMHVDLAREHFDNPRHVDVLQGMVLIHLDKHLVAHDASAW